MVASSSRSPDLQCCDTSATQTSPTDVENGGSLVEDPNFLKDLLQKAEGDQTKVKDFLRQLGLAGEQKMDGKSKEVAMPNKCPDDIDAAAAEAGAPETFFCPISFHFFRDPVLLPTGQTYERWAIEQWLSQGTPTCPVTGVMMKQPVPVTPNVALRRAIEDWGEKNAPWLLGPNGKVLPIPESEIRNISNGGLQMDRDYVIAVRVQEEARQQRLTSWNTTHQERHQHAGPATVQGAQRRPTVEVKRISRCLNLLWCITALHLAVFLTTYGLSGWKFEKLDVNPLIGFSATGLSRVGATNYPAIVEEKEWWRIIVSAFVNTGFIHLEATLAAVWAFGRFLAINMSFLSIATLYVVSGTGGVLVSANFATDVVTGGASGAVFGLMGAIIMELMLNRGAYHFSIISLLVLGAVGTVNVVIGLTPFADNWCAIGGLVCGTLTGGAIVLGRTQGNYGPVRDALILSLQLLFSVASITVFVTAIAGLLIKFDGHKECTWCRRVTCINTKWWSCDAAAILPDNCVYNVAGNLTTKISCPSGEEASVEISQPTQETLEQHCQDICGVRKQMKFRVPAPELEQNGSFRPGGGFVPTNNTA